MSINYNTLNIEYRVFFNETIEPASVKLALENLCEHYGLNRNFLIFCLWFAKTGRGRLRKTLLHELLHSLLIWDHAIVVNLQKLREALSKYLPRTHLAPERIERLNVFVGKIYREAEQVCLLSRANLHHIESQARTEVKQLSDAMNNILTYLSLMQVHIEENESEPFIMLLSGAFPFVGFDALQNAWLTVSQKYMCADQQQISLEF